MSPDHVTPHSAPTPSGSAVKPPVPPVAATDPGPIPRSALVCGSSHAESDLVRDLRSVAMGAACQWTRARSSECITGTPEEFGTAAARVYLAALHKLNAGFEPGAECPVGRR